MASTFSQNLKIELVPTGEQPTTWGTTANNNFVNVFEDALVGRANPVFTTNADLTLSFLDNVSDQIPRYLYLNVTSTVVLSTQLSLIVPTIFKPYIIENNTQGGQSILVKTVLGAGIVVPNGSRMPVYVNSIDVVAAYDALPALKVGTTNITGTNIRLPGSVGSIAGSATNNTIIYNTTSQTWEAGPTAITAGVSQIVAGTNVTVSPVGGTGIVTVSATGGSGGGGSPLSFGAGLLPAAGSYNGTVPVTVSVDTTNLVTLMGMQSLSNKTLVQPVITSMMSGAGLLTVPAVTGTILTNVSGVSRIVAGSNIVITPTTGVGDITISATGGGSGGGGVSQVTVTAPLSNALTFSNPTTTPALTIQNSTSASTEFLRADGTWAVPAGGGGGGSGTVTSITMTVPAEFTVTPATAITTAGTFAITKASQAINLVYASPTAAAGVPTFRALAALDIAGAAATVAPLASASTAAVGISNLYARQDHVHPFTVTTTGTSGAATYVSGTLNIPQYAGVTKVSGLSDVSIIEPTYVDSTLIIASFTATIITTTAAVGANVVVGDFIRGDNTAANAPFAKVTAVLGSTITVASTVGFGFVDGGSIYKPSATTVDGQVFTYDLATNKFVLRTPTGTVTSVAFAAPLNNTFSVTNGTTAAVIGVQNATTPATQFLRADGMWVVPAGGSSTAYDFGTFAAPVEFTLDLGPF